MNPAKQWAGVVGGALVWLAYLQISYALSPGACNAGDKTALMVVTVIALLAVAGTGFFAWRSWQEAGAHAATEEGGATGRSRFMGIAGLGLSALFALVVLSNVVPIIFLGACD
jgi:hypothetical protein